MSKRRFENLLKRKFSSVGKLFSVRGFEELEGDEFVKNQFRVLSRLGGDLIVMQMGN